MIQRRGDLRAATIFDRDKARRSPVTAGPFLFSTQGMPIIA
jgi:hypothetical protein